MAGKMYKNRTPAEAMAQVGKKKKKGKKVELPGIKMKDILEGPKKRVPKSFVKKFDAYR